MKHAYMHLITVPHNPVTISVALTILLALFTQVPQNMNIWETATLCQTPWCALNTISLHAALKIPFQGSRPTALWSVESRFHSQSLRAIASLLQACLPFTSSPQNFTHMYLLPELLLFCLHLSFKTQLKINFAVTFPNARNGKWHLLNCYSSCSCFNHWC